MKETTQIVTVQVTKIDKNGRSIEPELVAKAIKNLLLADDVLVMNNQIFELEKEDAE